MERRLSIISRVEQQENGNNQPRITNTETIILMLKCYVGTGILAMPVAIKKGGLVTGTIGKMQCPNILIRNISRLGTDGDSLYLLYAPSRVELPEPEQRHDHRGVPHLQQGLPPQLLQVLQ